MYTTFEKVYVARVFSQQRFSNVVDQLVTILSVLVAICLKCE